MSESLNHSFKLIDSLNIFNTPQQLSFVMDDGWLNR